MGFPGGSNGKESAWNAGDLGSVPCQEDPLEEDMAIHSSIFAWRVPLTQEPGGLQYVGLQRVKDDWAWTLSRTTGQSLGLHVASWLLWPWSTMKKNQWESSFNKGTSAHKERQNHDAWMETDGISRLIEVICFAEKKTGCRKIEQFTQITSSDRD